MAITTYLPTKFQNELAQFKLNNGNIRIDYRDTNSSAPSIFSTGLSSFDINLGLTIDTIPTIIPTEAHVTGDSSNYRRFTTDLVLTTNDYQRNIVFLYLNGTVFSVAYKKTIYDEENEYKYFKHCFTFIDEYEEIDNLSKLEPLSISTEEVVKGYVDTQKVVALTRSTEFDDFLIYSSYYDDTIDVGTPYIVLEEDTTETYPIGTVINPNNVSTSIKELHYYLLNANNDDFNTKVLYSSALKVNRSQATPVLSSTNSSVLNETYTNFYLYSTSISDPSNHIGYIVNINPATAAMLHLVSETDSVKPYTSSLTRNIGFGSMMYGTEYTGLLSSPFLLLKFDFTSQTDNYYISINNGAKTIVGAYTSQTFKYLCAKLSDLLYPHGILVIPCKNNIIAFDRFKGTGPVEINFYSSYTKITTLPKFTSFEYLNGTKVIDYNPVLHPFNYSFTYEDNEESDIRYKLKISEDTGDRGNVYASYRVRFIFDVHSVRNTTQSFKLEVEEGVLDTSFTITDIIPTDTVIDNIWEAISNFLPSYYTVQKDYLTSSIDIINNQATDSTFIKVTTGTWMRIDPQFGGVYVENPDGSKTIIMTENDGSLIVTNGSGTVAFSTTGASSLTGAGYAVLNPITNEFDSESLISLHNNSYCEAIQEVNKKLCSQGYEAVPLYDTSTSDISYFIGINRIVETKTNNKAMLIWSDINSAISTKQVKSAKDMYRETSSGKVKLIQNNASIEEWKNKIGNNRQALEITENFPTIYSRTITGKLAARDNIIVSSVKPGYATTSTTNPLRKDLILNPLTDPNTTIKRLLIALGCITDSEEWYVGAINTDGDNLTCSYVNTNKGLQLTFNKVTFDFTLKIVDPGSYCTTIGFNVAGDIQFPGYKGWIKQPQGYNTIYTNYEEVEAKAQCYTLILNYSTNDGV